MNTTFREIMGLLSNTREGVRPGIQHFPEVAQDQLARELRLDDRGASDGSAGSPRPDSPQVLAEAEITQAIESRARKAYEDYETQIELYDGRIRRAVVTSDIRVKVEAAGRNALADFSARVDDETNHLQLARNEVREREQEFERFRADHQLRRLPILRSSGQIRLQRWLFALLVVLESILNGTFFAQGSEAGLIGGVLQAFVLSVLNIGAAAAFGRLALPLLRHRRAVYQIGGAVLTIGYSMWLLGLNLAIGHYRDLYALGDGSVKVTDILSKVRGGPVLPAEAESVILVVLGIFLALGTLVGTVVGSETYPGYEGVGARHRDAVQALADAKTESLRGLTALRDDAVSQMSAAIEGIRAAQHDLADAVTGRSRLHRKFLAYLDHLSTVNQGLVMRYREANRRARSLPAPAEWDNPASRPGFLSAPSLPPVIEDDGRLREEVVARIGRYIDDINLAFEATLPQLREADRNAPS